jgi:hypothetical protein
MTSNKPLRKAVAYMGLALLVRRQAMSLRPLDQVALGVPNGAAKFYEGWAVTLHPGLGQPRQADAQTVGRFPWGE